MNSTGANKNIAKLMLNSLYGKFGMSPIIGIVIKLELNI